MIVIFLCDCPRLDIIVVKFNVKFFVFAHEWHEITHINYVDKGEASTRHKYFIVMKDQEYFIADLLEI